MFRDYPRTLVTGILSSLVTFVLFYLMTVFALSWGTTALGYSRATFLVIQLIGVRVLRHHDSDQRARSPRAWPARDADLGDGGDRRVRVRAGAAAVGGLTGAALAMIVGLSLMGLTYGPLGTVLSELFPTRVRYTGSSLTFNLAGIFGASLAPYIATWLAQNYGLQYVGYYLTAASALTLVGLVSIHETRDTSLD